MILHRLVDFFGVCHHHHSLSKRGHSTEEPGKTNVPIINRRAVFLVISHCLLLIKVFSVCILNLNPLWFYLFTWCFPRRFNFFFKDLTSTVCLPLNKQSESSELEGCSPPVSLKVVKRKRQRGERSCFRKAKPRSEEGMSLLCSEKSTCELYLGWAGMGQGTLLHTPVPIPEPTLLHFPPPDITTPKIPKAKSFCLLIHTT